MAAQCHIWSFMLRETVPAEMSNSGNTQAFQVSSIFHQKNKIKQKT